MWVPGHSKIEANERVDALAGGGSARTHKSTKPFRGIIIAAVKKRIQDLLNLEHLEIWQTSEGCRQVGLFL